MYTITLPHDVEGEKELPKEIRPDIIVSGAAEGGREAVLGLVAMKEALEDPARLLLDL